MNYRNYTVKVLKSTTNPATHLDVSKPQEATKPGLNGQKGKFFQISISTNAEIIVTKNGNFNLGRQGRRILFNLWDTGVRQLEYERLQSALADSDNYIVEPVTGNLLIKPEVFAVCGILKKEECGFIHELKNRDGKPLINSITKKPVKQNFIQIFIFDFEDEEGTGDIILQSEIQRAKRNEVTIDEDNVTGGPVNP